MKMRYKNGKVDLGEDQGQITQFAKDERVGVGYRSLGDKNLGTVAYLAYNGGRESLVSSRFLVSPSDSKVTHIQSDIVAKVDWPANIVSPALTGTIQDLNTYDPVNDEGQVAFWAKTSTSSEAIVRANPKLKPILIVPGIGASLPEPGKFIDWLLNRGAPPDSMVIDPILHSHDDLIQTLKNAGYVEGVNLFVATYDWRLNPGPIDGTIDGKINLPGDDPVTKLTDDTYEYAVEHLAFWLKEAVKGWRSQFPELPESEIPALDSVDIITHSTGGLVARSYIQSDAYGKSFSLKKDLEINLPKVNNLFMLGVPNLGASLAWNPLNNNFLGGAGSILLKHITRLAFEKVSQGKTIALSGNKDPNLGGVIAPPAAGTQLDPVAFIEQYVPTVRSLLATYPFIRQSSDSEDTLRTIKSIDSTQQNTLLLDLNNGFDLAGGGDPNLFADKVNQVSVIYGTNEKTRDAVWERKQPNYNIPVGNLFPKKTVLKLNDIDILPTVPEPEETWYIDEEGKAAEIIAEDAVNQGDGTVPLLSAAGTFLVYPKGNIERKPFTKGGIFGGGNTNGSVTHNGLVSNIDVQKLILETLGVSLDEKQISTDKATLNFDTAKEIAAILSETLFDPVEGFLVDGLGRRLGYSSATGPITEIPNSFWLGEEDGIGLFSDPLEGPFQLQLTGLGEEYFVSISLETEVGLVGGLEARGFLAKGEQKTFDIPINNAPTLDLNGAAQGIDFSTTGTLGATIALANPSLVLADSDSPNLQGATIALTNPTNGTQESLKATSVGNITVTYDPTTHTLSLDGTDTLANYQQVLKTVTYTNTATTLNSVPREIAFVVDDGVEFNNLSAVAKTTLTLTAPPPTAGELIKGTSGRDTLVGTNGNDIIIGFQKGDKLTGKGGNDQFVYKTLKDGIDTITDFEVGKDKIVLSEVLKKLGYKGSNPLGDGRVQISSQRGNSFLHIDPDGFAGNAGVQTLAQVTGVTQSALDHASNFVF